MGCAAANLNSGKPGPVAALWRVLPTDTDGVTGQLLTDKHPNGTALDNYYYYYQDLTGGTLKCSSDTTVRSVSASFDAAAAKITKA